MNDSKQVEYKKINKSKFLLIVAIFFIFIGILIFISSQKSGADVRAALPESYNDKTSDLHIHKVGQHASIGIYDVNIVSVSDNSIDGRRFVSIKTSLLNASKESGSVFSAMFKLTDTMGRVYDANVARSDVADLNVNPGVQREGTAVFEVANDSVINTVRVFEDAISERNYVEWDINR